MELLSDLTWIHAVSTQPNPSTSFVRSKSPNPHHPKSTLITFMCAAASDKLGPTFNTDPRIKPLSQPPSKTKSNNTTSYTLYTPHTSHNHGWILHGHRKGHQVSAQPPPPRPP